MQPGKPDAARDLHTPAAAGAARPLSYWRERWQAEPFHRFLGVELEEQHDGRSRISLKMTTATPRGAGGGVQGGVLATLVDLACITAVASQLRPNEVMAGTAELNISYLRPALASVVFAEGRVLKKGRSLAVVDVDCSDGQGRLFAKGRVSYALRRRTGEDIH